MKFDLNRYIVNRVPIHRWYLQHGHKNPDSAVSMISTAYGVPVICCAHWIGEITGYPDYIVNNIHSLMAYYGYTEILNKPENCPF